MNNFFKKTLYVILLVFIFTAITSCKKMESDIIGELQTENGTFQWYDLEWGQSISSTESSLGFSLSKEPYLATESDINYEKDDYDFADFYPKDLKDTVVNIYECIGKTSYGFSSNELTSVSIEIIASDNTAQNLATTAEKILERVRNVYGNETNTGGFSKGSDGKSSESYFWNSETSSTRLGIAINKINDQIDSIIMEVGTYSTQ